MLLAIDVGNTNIALGVYKDAELEADWLVLLFRQGACEYRERRFPIQQKLDIPG